MRYRFHALRAHGTNAAERNRRINDGFFMCRSARPCMRRINASAIAPRGPGCGNDRQKAETAVGKGAQSGRRFRTRRKTSTASVTAVSGRTKVAMTALKGPRAS